MSTKEIVHHDKPPEDGKREASQNFAVNLLGKMMLRKLINWLGRGAESWECEPEDIYMMLRIKKDGDPEVIVAESVNNNYANLQEKLGAMEDIANLMFKQLLRAVHEAAKDWNCPTDEVIMILKIEDKNPLVRIQEMKGEKRYFDLDY